MAPSRLAVIVGRRWPLLAALFVAEIVGLVLVSSIPFGSGDQQRYQNAANQTLTPILNSGAVGQVAAIFANNFKVAAFELVPIIGLVFYGISIYQTGKIIEILGISKGVGSSGSLLVLFSLPSTWLELPAYAIAVGEGVYLTYAALSAYGGGGWGRLREELRYVAVNLLLIAGVLIVAATFEVTEIQIESTSKTLIGQLSAYLTWFPFMVLLALGIVYWERARRQTAPPPAAEGEGEAPPGGQAGTTGGTTGEQPPDSSGTPQPS